MEPLKKASHIDIYMDRGMTIKKTLYNALYDHGIFLPEFTSNCVTLDSLENIRSSDQFYIYYSGDLRIEITRDDVLIAPLELVYEFIQRFHLEKHKRPLPFQVCPPTSYLKPILRHIDPENRMSFLKKTWRHNYRSDLVLVGTQAFCYEPRQGQALQKRVDQELNNALRLQNMRIGLTLKKAELEQELLELRGSITAEDLALLNDVDKRAFTQKDVVKIYDEMINHLANETPQAVNIEIVEEVDAAIRDEVNLSDIGEDPEEDANLVRADQVFTGRHAYLEKPNVKRSHAPTTHTTTHFAEDRANFSQFTSITGHEKHPTESVNAAGEFSFHQSPERIPEVIEVEDLGGNSPEIIKRARKSRGSKNQRKN